MTPNYDPKATDESVWAALQIGVGAVTAWILLSSTSMDNALAATVGTTAGVLVRPVFGYILSWLPTKKQPTVVVTTQVTPKVSVAEEVPKSDAPAPKGGA